MNQPINIDPSTCEDIVCECGNKLWIEVKLAKRIPGIAVGSRDDVVAFNSYTVCTMCKKSIEEAIKPKSPLINIG